MTDLLRPARPYRSNHTVHTRRMIMISNRIFAAILYAQLLVWGVSSFAILNDCETRGRTTFMRLAKDDNEKTKRGGFFQAFGEFWQELDAFMDDASARRLGNGAAFYGKRKSNFYGENDKNKKSDRNTFDATEDYLGPSSSGYFSWKIDENGQWRPVSRMKNQALDKQSKM